MSMELQTRRINTLIVLITFLLHFYCLSFQVNGYCPNTLQDRILLPKFRLQRLVNLDWMGCILACGNEAKCFSYNFCHRELEGSGICDLNGCWVEENKDYGEDISLLVHASGCFFQQLPKNIQDFPGCRREENLKKQSRWIKANLSPKCLKTNVTVQVTMPYSGAITSLKLSHIKGHLTCNYHDPKCDGKWGCSCCKICSRGYTNKRLDIIITNAYSNRIFPSDRFPSKHSTWYIYPYQTNKDQNLVFPNLTVPLVVKRNEPLVVWYSGHLLDRGPARSKSRGKICFDVYAFYTEITA